MARITLKNSKEIEGLRKAGHLVAETFKLLEPHVKPGVSLLELDRIAEEFIRSQGAIPAYVGYSNGITPFPNTLCISVNEVICHGIPSPRKLREGDIVGVDIGVKLGGFYGDACYTYTVGSVSPATQRLVDTARECLEAGIREVKPGARIGDIGAAIQELAEGRGYGVVREYIGHGVGRNLHEAPDVPHFGRRGTGTKLVPGMVFTIEPMINAGGYETEVLEDTWTVVTRDRSLSAQFEHTVAVTESGVDILTL
ncbi:methionyl aminopeptidase [Deinobacterium chartae]|uniref:Methionine aminopeptidase n=1 Tax=Deinobacterium chartae TaxID=521158 RepID=A0A841HXU1_9DEIO|nr:type I methionyl aminopeptidase [Deinobacterium chartae]MBB6097693.1 methionyl aminopeptidase [Deinobacterium chartae]